MKVPEIRLPGWKRPTGLSGWQRVAVVVGLAVLLLATMSVAATARVGASSGRILTGVTVAGQKATASTPWADAGIMALRQWRARLRSLAALHPAVRAAQSLPPPQADGLACPIPEM